MRLNTFILGICFFVLVSGCRKEIKSDPGLEIPEGYSLIWSDEFDTNGLPDNSKWSYNVGGSGWGNSEEQYYTGSRLNNAEIKNGYLYITAQKEDFEGKQYTSARLVTKGKGDWQYGRIEVRTKLPQGVGLWPAIWMLPSDNTYGKWPDSGEIDIMESLGHIPNFVAATIQTKAKNAMLGTQNTTVQSVPDCYTTFHNYILEWDSAEMRIYVDKTLYNNYKNDGSGFENWPFDKPFHLILNIAVGGTFGGIQGIDDSIFPQSMVVDYVRVYKRN